MKRFLVSILISALYLSPSAAAPTVILPERFANAPVVVLNSPQFKALAAHDKALQAQLKKENKNWGDYSSVVEQRLRDQEQLISKLQLENAKLKSATKPWYSKIPFLSILSLGVSFFGNPFSFIITRLIELGLGLVAIVAFIALVRFLWRRRKDLKWKLHLPK